MSKSPVIYVQDCRSVDFPLEKYSSAPMDTMEHTCSMRMDERGAKRKGGVISERANSIF